LVADLSKEPPFAWREEALRRGFRGTVCLPLSERDRTFGVLVLYLSESRSLTAGEAIRLKELAENLAFGIVTFRARVAQRRIQAAVLAMAQGVSAANGEAFLEKLTASLVASVGADAGFISEFEPGQRNNARIISANVAGERVDVQDFDASEVPCVPEESEDCWLIPRTARRRDPQHPAMSLPPSGALAGIDLKDEHGRAAGMICLLFGETPTDSPLVLSTLRIFASRISAELRRQKADAELVRQAALIDEAPNGIIVEDLDGRIVFWSKGAERLYGWSRADAIGRKSAELFLVNHGWAGTGDALPESGTWAGEQMKTTADGTLVHVESRVTILRDAAGGPGSVLVIDTDITERKKLEEQFLRAQRMESIGTLAGGMAHDLNNALLPILMGASLLKRVVSDSSALTAVGNIERSALRASGLVKQVLSFARGVEGSRAPLAPSLIVNQVRTIVETSIPRSITLETTVQDPLWSIVGDVTQIQQVLLNLCVNARDAMPTGGRMSIAASNAELDAAAIAREGGLVPGRYLKFEVSDTGVGIPPDILHRIFEPFFTTKEMVSAPGLGLSTSLGIVRSHGGFFRVVSELGKGSTFT
ncbi:MAG TPA: ATP-binding protein, partial [Thermoanaerobaculia bacterium]